MENSWLLMILDLARLLPFTAEIFISMTAMDIPDNFMRNLVSLKGHHSHIKMINGIPRSIPNGYLRKMPWWKSIWKRSSEVVRWIQKNNFCKMIEKFLNFSQGLKERPSLSTISLQMIHYRSEKWACPTLARTPSQSLSRGKNFQDNLRSINQAKHMHRISSKPMSSELVKTLWFLADSIYFKAVIILPETTSLQNTALIWHKI